MLNDPSAAPPPTIRVFMKLDAEALEQFRSATSAIARSTELALSLIKGLCVSGPGNGSVARDYSAFSAEQLHSGGQVLYPPAHAATFSLRIPC